MPFLNNLFSQPESIEKTNDCKEEYSKLQSKWKKLWDFLPLAICEIDHRGIIKDSNQAFLNLTSINPVSNYHRPISDFFIERMKFEEFLVVQKEADKFEEFTLNDYAKRRISVNVYKEKINEDGSILICLFDVSDMKNIRAEMEEKIKIRTEDIENSRTALLNMLEDTEEARARVEEEKVKTETIFTNFIDGLLVFNLNKELDLINSEAEKLLDIKRQDILGKNFSELKQETNLINLLDVLGGDINEVFRKELIVNQDLILEITSAFITAGKKKISFVVILHDVTREKAIEDLKSQFVTVAAHQLRTPLSIIKWGLGMFLAGDVGKLTADQKDLLGKTFQTNERMIKLVNDLLNVSKIEEGKYLYQPQVVDMEDIIKQVYDSSKDMADRRKIDLKLEIEKSEKGKLIKADVEKMNLAIKNLLDNAINYTETKGKVLIKLSREKDKINLSVSDTGVGIPEKQQNRIFSKFFRGANVVKMETDGTGLGLFITKNVLETHGGSISFESKEGKGTTFFITLPAAS
jgi:two-component system phosphate regulon sensor histidine kinase PhoR